MKKLHTKLTMKVTEKIASRIDKLFCDSCIAENDEESEEHKIPKENEYKEEDQGLKVLKIDEKDEDLPVLIQFLGKTIVYKNVEVLFTGETPSEQSNEIESKTNKALEIKRLHTKLTMKVTGEICCHFDKLFCVSCIAEKDEQYEETKDLIVFKMYEDDEDSPILKPFLGKTTDYANLQKLLTGKTPSEQSTALQELIKSYENNKALLSQLFANLLQYLNDIFSNVKDEEKMGESIKIMNSVAPYFYQTALIDRVSSRHSFAELLTEKYNNYRKKRYQIPDFDTIIFFSLASPITAFPHPVTTPCLTFMSEILTICRFHNAHSIIRGLFVCNLILDYYTLESQKNFVPAAINFLRGVLILSTKPTNLNPIKPVPAFNFHKDAKILILEDDCSKLDASWKITLKDLVTDSIDNGLKIRSVSFAVSSLKLFFDCCYPVRVLRQLNIFEAHRELLTSLEFELYPEKVARKIKRLENRIAYKTYSFNSVWATEHVSNFEFETYHRTCQ